LPTHNIKQLGFSGLRAFVLAPTFSTVDTNALRKPNRFILSNVSGHYESTCNEYLYLIELVAKENIFSLILKKRSMKKISIVFSMIFYVLHSLMAQSYDDYQQKVSECFSKKNYKCAEENLQASIQLVGEDFGNIYLLYSNLGTAQRRQGKYEDALASYDKAYKLRNNSSSVLSNRASLKRQMKDLDGSLDDYNKALEIAPNERALLLNRSQTKKMLSDTLGAEQDLLKMLDLDPKDFQALTNLTNIRVARGEFDLALSTYDKLISETPAEPILYNNRSDVYLKMANYDKAIVDVEQAIKLEKKYGNAYVTKAEILIAMGDRKKALKNLQKAVKLGENSSYVFRLIDECNKY